MTYYFVCPISDPLMFGLIISASSLDSCLLEYIKLYGFSPCCVFEASSRSQTRESLLSNLKFVDYIKKSKLKTIKNKYSTNFTQAGFF